MSRETLDLWFDTACPWAWMTSRWALEVAKVRDVDVRFHPMSLNILNRDRELPEDYRELIDRTLGPMRVVTAAIAEHGEEIAEPLYTAIGTRIHPGGEKDFDKAVAVSYSQEAYADMFTSLIPVEVIQPTDTAAAKRNLSAIARKLQTHNGWAGSGCTFGFTLTEEEDGCYVVMSVRSSISD